MMVTSLSSLVPFFNKRNNETMTRDGLEFYQRLKTIIILLAGCLLLCMANVTLKIIKSIQEWYTLSSSMETVRLIGVPSSIWSSACRTDFPVRFCGDYQRKGAKLPTFRAVARRLAYTRQDLWSPKAWSASGIWGNAPRKVWNIEDLNAIFNTFHNVVFNIG